MMVLSRSKHRHQNQIPAVYYVMKEFSFTRGQFSSYKIHHEYGAEEVVTCTTTWRNQMNCLSPDREQYLGLVNAMGQIVDLQGSHILNSER